MQFIWTFWNQGAKEDELRWSIRSVEKSCPVTKITVIGDQAPWYRGHLISKSKIPVVQYHNAMDVISKIEILSNHPEVEEEFVWMMDDVYFLKSCSIEDLSIPRSLKTHSSRGVVRKKWAKIKSNSFQLLKEKGYSTHDYATHLPHVISKEKLKKVFLEFDVKLPLLWEVLYGNMFRRDPVDCFPFLHSQSNPLTEKDLEEAEKKSIVLNHGNKKGWSLALRNWLERKYPQKSENEI